MTHSEREKARQRGIREILRITTSLSGREAESIFIDLLLPVLEELETSLQIDNKERVRELLRRWTK